MFCNRPKSLRNGNILVAKFLLVYVDLDAKLLLIEECTQIYHRTYIPISVMN